MVHSVFLWFCRENNYVTRVASSRKKVVSEGWLSVGGHKRAEAVVAAVGGGYCCCHASCEERQERLTVRDQA
jgi:hypothetical protein